MGLFRLSQGAPVCVTCAVLHRLAPLGTVLESMVRCAQSFVTERAGGYNILMSGWVAPYFSPGSARGIHSVSCNQAYGCERLQSFEWLARQKGVLGDCAHARNVVLARASMTFVARVLFVFHIHAHTTHTPHNNALCLSIVLYFGVCAHVCNRVCLCV